MTLNDMLFAHFNHYTTMTGMLLSKLYGRFKKVVTDVILTLLKCTGDNLISLDITGNTEQVQTVQGKNLYDKDKISILVNTWMNSTEVATSSGARVWHMPCIPNTTYTVSRQLIGVRFAVATTDTVPATGVPVSNYALYNNASNITIATGVTAKYLVCYYYLASTDTYTEEELRASYQVELGATATLYESFVPDSPSPDYPSPINSTGDLVTSGDADWNTDIEYGKTSFVGNAPSELGVDCYRVPIVVSGKNLFDKTNITPGYRLDNTTGELKVNALMSTTDYISVIGSYITISGVSDTASKHGAFYDNAYTFVSGFYSIATVEIPANAAYLRYTVPLDNLDTAQIQFGSTATAYEPYTGTATYNIYLDAPLRYGDTLDENGLLARARGAETGVTGATYSPTGAKADGAYLCTQDVTGSMVAGEITFAEAVTGATVEFDLAIPTIENVTMPSSIPTFKGTTIIQLDTTTQPTVLEAEYWATEETE